MILGPDGKPIQRPITGEIITAEKMSVQWGQILNILPDPDLILQKTGKTAEVFEEMENDPHVWACLFSRKSGVLSKDWDIMPASDSPKDQEIATFVKSALDDLDIDSLIRQMLDAPFHGYSVHEAIWKESKERWVFDAFKDKPQKHFGFDADSNLMFKSIYSLNGELMPPAKFLVTRHEGSEKKPYGVRLGSKCLWPWIFKKHGFKFWAIFTEKYGMPLAIGKYSPGASKQDKDDLVQALIDLVQDAAVAIPSNSEVDFKDTGEGKEKIHQLFLEFCESSISKAILGQTLTTQIGETGGAYAAAKVHSDVRDDIIGADAKMVMAAMSNQPIWWLVDFNFGRQERYPRFVINYESEETQKDRAERDKNLVAMGLPIGTRYFYSRYNIPEPKGSEAVVVPLTLTSRGFMANTGKKEMYNP
jgi:phage gp29-like protein